ncbi:hypothetical protein VNO80_24799 [Phaseolus coccineus]|uniref:Uncharacterized protein n=1 Tax=Phaseolus coccineus TaxID=3886 RepID=A0AAN9LY92_PHACN
MYITTYCFQLNCAGEFHHLIIYIWYSIYGAPHQSLLLCDFIISPSTLSQTHLHANSHFPNVACLTVSRSKAFILIPSVRGSYDASKFGREVEVLFSVSKELLSKRSLSSISVYHLCDRFSSNCSLLFSNNETWRVNNLDTDVLSANPEFVPSYPRYLNCIHGCEIRSGNETSYPLIKNEMIDIHFLAVAHGRN